MRVTRARRLTVFSAAVAGVVAACFAAVARHAEAGDPLIPGHVSVLDRPQQAQDALPSKVLALPSAHQFAGTPRRSQVSGKGDYLYVVPGKGGSLCLVVVKGQEVTTACAGRTLLLDQTIFVAERDEAGKINVFGIVDDSVVSVGNTKPSANTFVVYDLSSTALPLRTVAGATHILDLEVFMG
jgi:hypothetical protein